MMTAKFTNASDFHAAIAAAVIAGLTFEAYGDTGNGEWTIVYTGGY